MLIDSAKYSIDVQYYLWYGDDAGRILAKRLLDAADRGVKDEATDSELGATKSVKTKGLP